MPQHFVGFMAIFFLAAFAACGQQAEPDPAADATAEIDETTTIDEPAVPPTASIAAEYAPELSVDLAAMNETPTGLRYQDMVEGTGATAAAGNTVVVHYTGWLPDGTKFDSSRDRTEPFEFVLGEGRVIPGWEEGVAGMKVGGTRQLVIPPSIGYGDAGAGGVIPPGATLVFEVELLETR